GGSNADNHLVFSPFELSALDNVHIVAHVEGGLLNTSQGYIGVSSGRAFWQVNDNEELSRSEGAFLAFCEAGSIRHQARVIFDKAADHFTVSAAPQYDRRIRCTGGSHGMFKANCHRKDSDQDANDAGHAEERGRD